MKAEYLIMLSEIIDKMEIAKELKNLDINTGNEEKDNEELGKQLIMLIFTHIYKCKKEFYTFIAKYKGYLSDEEEYDDKSLFEKAYKTALAEAKKENIIPILKDILSIDGVKDFLAIA